MKKNHVIIIFVLIATLGFLLEKFIRQQRNVAVANLPVATEAQVKMSQDEKVTPMHLSQSSKGDLENREALKRAPGSVYKKKSAMSKVAEDVLKLKEIYRLKTAMVNTQSNNLELELIKNQIRAYPSLYSEVLTQELEKLIDENNIEGQKEILALAASLPLGPSSIQFACSRLLLDLSNGEQVWDESLFRYALQLYYVQAFFRGEVGYTIIAQLVDATDNESQKHLIKSIGDSLSTNFSNEENSESN